MTAEPASSQEIKAWQDYRLWQQRRPFDYSSQLVKDRIGELIAADCLTNHHRQILILLSGQTGPVLNQTQVARKLGGGWLLEH